MPRRAFYRYEEGRLSPYSVDYPPPVYYTVHEQQAMADLWHVMEQDHIPIAFEDGQAAQQFADDHARATKWRTCIREVDNKR